MSGDPILLSLLEGGLAHCRAVVAGDGDLLASLFLAGLIGSLAHCAGMCGPFVLAQTVARLDAIPAAEMREFHRLSGGALVPYHLGRATTYAGLGAAGAAFAGGLISATGLSWLSAALLAAAAVLFAGYGLQRLGLRLPWPDARTESTAAQWLGRLAKPLFARPVGWRGYLLGVVLGFLPCGLLYGAVAAAAASGSALTGALAMVAFVLGTVPALVAIGIAGQAVGRQWRSTVVRAMPVLMLLNAAALSYFAWRTIS
jgi:hypothetical protein